MLRLTLALCLALLTALPATARERFTFSSIDGGTIDSADWQGHPVLVVNTASRCAFTRQYDALQDLYNRYRDQGLVVLAVPSNDFRQELDSDAAVKDFCAVNFDLDLPMTTITHVTGPEAHPFYRWLDETADFAPSWNFNKVLLAPDGAVIATWGSAARPLSSSIVDAIEAQLGGTG
ncbi:glutathione peroxidase [Roseivivax marinus]|uniref:glutathione peroxidase n=1 Tax=Roseivivax marinus TaxID=1379903 RepID=UPI0008B07F4F|nr:glutathione peroxidase [Roseivivax marinus]SEL15458.1 glutathione peroxidase [Roseivivax marinus]